MVKNLGLGTGRRKTSVARVYLRQGKGEILVNGKVAEEYFQNKDLMFIVHQPLEVTDTLNKFDILINVFGGGKTGQAQAIRHGIARGILALDPETREALKVNGFLTRDPRAKERKKPGLKGARKAPQWSKR